MSPQKVVYQIVGIICMILALLGAFMYPLNTMGIIWVILYEVTILFAVSGILLLIQREGFGADGPS
jgi:membrane-bound ClpP family serine protease